MSCALISLTMIILNDDSDGSDWYFCPDINNNYDPDNIPLDKQQQLKTCCAITSYQMCCEEGCAWLGVSHPESHLPVIGACQPSPNEEGGGYGSMDVKWGLKPVKTYYFDMCYVYDPVCHAAGTNENICCLLDRSTLCVYALSSVTQFGGCIWRGYEGYPFYRGTLSCIGPPLE
eukprot:GHVH01016264.1.p1 GENE.GHVH01016264.1~~GHVH01016264.1.p1  ORF type:complete len:174 (+),score=15.12 GHVH01016264.1:43-564(+)